MKLHKFTLGGNRFQLERLAQLQNLRANFARIIPLISKFAILRFGVRVENRQHIGRHIFRELFLVNRRGGLQHQHLLGLKFIVIHQRWFYLCHPQRINIRHRYRARQRLGGLVAPPRGNHAFVDCHGHAAIIFGHRQRGRMYIGV